MPATSPVSFRFTPEVKTLLEKAAASDHRSQTNFMESLIRTYCAKKGIHGDAPVASKTNKTTTKGQS